MKSFFFVLICLFFEVGTWFKTFLGSTFTDKQLSFSKFALSCLLHTCPGGWRIGLVSVKVKLYATIIVITKEYSGLITVVPAFKV